MGTDNKCLGICCFCGSFHVPLNLVEPTLNPAVTVGLAFAGKFSWSLVPTYFAAQLLGAMFGSWLAYLVYIDHYRATSDEGAVKYFLYRACY